MLGRLQGNSQDVEPIIMYFTYCSRIENLLGFSAFMLDVRKELLPSFVIKKVFILNGKFRNFRLSRIYDEHDIRE